MWRGSRKELQNRRKLLGVIYEDDHFDDSRDDHKEINFMKMIIMTKAKVIMIIQRLVRGQLERAQQGLEAAAR